MRCTNLDLVTNSYGLRRAKMNQANLVELLICEM